MISSDINPKQFLVWIKNRLFIKHKEIDPVIKDIDFLLANYSFIKNEISDEIIDKICRQHYADFDMNQCELNIGYSDEQRNSLRSFIRCVIEEAKCAE